MLYDMKAKVFATNLGKDFGRTVHITVIANNKEEAYKEAEKSLKNYCANLKKNHNNKFNFTDLTIE